MPRTYNRRAFGNLTSPLMELYGKLVAVELALKDVHAYRPGLPKTDPLKLAFDPSGHNILGAIQSLNYPSPVLTGLTALEAQLRTLKADGGSLDPRKYPHLRYLDHQSDHPDGSTDTDLHEALRLLRALIQHLDAHWQTLTQPPVVP